VRLHGRPKVAAAATLVITVAAALLQWPAAGADTSGTVHLQTVPSMAGVALSVGGEVVRTGPDGAATLSVADLNGVADTVTIPDHYVTATLRVRMTHVVVLPHVEPHVSNLQVGVAVTSLMRIRVWAGRTGIDPTTVRRLRLHSVTGIVRTVNPQRVSQFALLARLPRLVHNRLEVQTVTWSVDSVVADPGVAVGAERVPFDPLSGPEWRLRLRPIAGTVHIRTVPATAQVEFVLDGTSAMTDRNGEAMTSAANLNDVNERLRLASAAAGDRQVSILKVTTAPQAALHERELVVALEVSRPIRLRFVDERGVAVPTHRVSAVQLHSGQRSVTVQGAAVRQPIMLGAAIAERAGTEWRVNRIAFTITSVTVDGGEAVFAGQQRFEPVSAAVWTVRLAVFTITVTARDALFGTRVGSTLLVTRPDGAILRRVTVGVRTPALLPSIVRGDYDLRVQAALIGGTTPVHISRDDHLDLRVVTRLDAIAVAAFVALLVAAAMYAAARVTRAEGSAG
jgi:hypothetical protein